MQDNYAQDAIHIGQKLRAARLQQELSLRELAERAEVSASLLSKIENSKATPSVRSLHSIAEALSLPVNYFFPEVDQDQETLALPESAQPTSQPQTQRGSSILVANMTPSEFRIAQSESAGLDFTDESHQANEPVVRASARQSIELLGGIIWERLTPTAEEGVEFLQIYYEVGAKSGERMSHHKGREFHMVLEGELLLELGFERYYLKTGDSIIFDSTTPHRLSNAGKVPMRAISIIFNKE